MDYILKAKNQTAIQRARFTTQDPSVDSTITNMKGNENGSFSTPAILNTITAGKEKKYVN